MTFLAIAKRPFAYFSLLAPKSSNAASLSGWSRLEFLDRNGDEPEHDTVASNFPFPSWIRSEARNKLITAQDGSEVIVYYIRIMIADGNQDLFYQADGAIIQVDLGGICRAVFIIVVIYIYMLLVGPLTIKRSGPLARIVGKTVASLGFKSSKEIL